MNGLRDYGTAAWLGGDPACDHKQGSARQDGGRVQVDGFNGSARPDSDKGAMNYRDRCGKCGATRADKQIGLEATPEAYVAVMVDVFREVRRVLRRDGTLWLNLGDSYATNRNDNDWMGSGASARKGAFIPAGLKAKDMIGIPWRVAFALQADGWVLRQEIIWQKPNPMPESVTDRCTKAHEQIFLFAKAQWIGPEPGRFAHISDEDARWLALCIDTEGCIVVKRTKQNDGGADAFAPQVSFGGTNRPLMERFRQIVGHGNLAEREGQNAPMIYWQAGNNIAADFLRRIYPFLIVKQRQARIGIHVDTLTYYRGGKKPARKQRTEAENDALMSLWARGKECNQFGTPDLSDVPEPEFGRWGSCARYHYDAAAIAEPFSAPPKTPGGFAPEKAIGPMARSNGHSQWEKRRTKKDSYPNDTRNKRSVWEVATAPFKEAHFATFPPALIEPCILAGCPKGGTVLDPFGGAGTTGLVADRLQRSAILIELNPAYLELAADRNHRRCTAVCLGNDP